MRRWRALAALPDREDREKNRQRWPTSSCPARWRKRRLRPIRCSAASARTSRAKLDRIKKARKDANIQALYLQLDGLSIGWAKLDELSRAIADFRKAGKKVFAYLEAGSTKDYLVALACDEVCLPEPGWLMLTGMRAEVSFYKDLFEKIGVKADMLQMGDFKAAAEPFMRSSMSEPARKQLTSVLDDYFDNSLVERIVQSRADKKLTAEQVKKLIDEGPYTARGRSRPDSSTASPTPTIIRSRSRRTGSRPDESSSSRITARRKRRTSISPIRSPSFKLLATHRRREIVDESQDRRDLRRRRHHHRQEPGRPVRRRDGRLDDDDRGHPAGRGGRRRSRRSCCAWTVPAARRWPAI